MAGPITRSNVWDLGADPGALDDVARKWRDLATAATTARSTFAAKVSSTVEAWQTEQGDDFVASYSGEQQSGLQDAHGACSDVATVVSTLAGHLSDVQSRLDASWRRVSVVLNDGRGGDTVRFDTEDGDDVKLVDHEHASAAGDVDDARDRVREAGTALGKLPEVLQRIETGWQGEADGSSFRWTNRPSLNVSYRSVQTFGDTTVVNGNGESEKVVVSIDPDTGDTVLTFYTDASGPDDEKYDWQEQKRVTVPKGQHLVLNTGSGNDIVEVPEGTDLDVRLMLGEGDDHLDGRAAVGDMEAFGGSGKDRISTGHGADFTSGGADTDYVNGGFGDDRAFGGSGHDSMYGLDGDDLVSGGSGRDYIDGGEGSDTLLGGTGDDQVGGGFGDDRLYGGSGDDHLYAGGGQDVSDGGVTNVGGVVVGDGDQLTQESGDTVHGDDAGKVVTIEIDASDGAFMEVKGSPEFVAQVRSDLAMMASTPTGQQMLNKLEELHDEDDGSWWFGQDKRPYVISEYPTDLKSDNSDAWDADANYSEDPPQDDAYCIRYRPDFQTLDNDDDADYDATPPMVVLYHEMGHTYQFLSDTEAEGKTRQGSGEVNSIERQNVGLSYYEKDHFWNSDTGDPNHEEDESQHAYRENGIRDELGIPDRTSY